LSDKQDQIEHWLSNANSQDNEDKHIKELEKVDKELDALKNELAKINKNLPDEKHYFRIKNRIREEETAISYWNGKLREVGEEGNG